MTGRRLAESTASRAAVRAVSRPHDPHEREADRAADVVARGGTVAGWSFSNVPLAAPAPVQRQEAAKPKSDDEKLKDAALKAGEAALETPQGKALKEQVLADPLVKTVTDAVTTTPGKVAAGAAIVGGVGALAATGKALPIQPPAIPLDRITPGLSAKVAYEGPVNAPTFVGLTLRYREPAPKGKDSAKGDPIAADIARLKAQQEMFRPKSEKDAAKKAEQDMVDAWVRTQMPGLKSGMVIPLPAAPAIDEEKKPVQPAPASPSAAPPAIAHVDDAIASPSRPLPDAIRRSMESRFGRDFSRVRIHADARAAETATSIDAGAFTVGADVVFAPGRFDPTTPDGRHLIAHEMAHVVQQSQGRGLSSAGGHGYPWIQREPTRPRAVTGSASLADLSARTASVSGKTTVGRLAKLEWESLFKRHFVEPDTEEYVTESSHARYIYSRIYGWIDAMHFFAHIQYAEDKGLAGATEEGIQIERKQALVRRLVGPDPDDTSIYNDLLEGNLMTPEDFLWYREGTFMAIDLALNTMLPADQQALLKGFSEEQRAKLMLDNAMSAWSYEDLVSNQLGVQFFGQFGAHCNAGSGPDEVRARFGADLTAFFTSIQVVDNAAEVKRLAKNLPGRERWTAPKLTLEKAQKKYPELFSFGPETHRVRIAVYDRYETASAKRTEIAKRLPALGPGLVLERFDASRFALYTDARSQFMAVLAKWAIDQAVPTGQRGALVERQPPPKKPVYGPQP